MHLQYICFLTVFHKHACKSWCCPPRIPTLGNFTSVPYDVHLNAYERLTGFVVSTQETYVGLISQHKIVIHGHGKTGYSEYDYSLLRNYDVTITRPRDRRLVFSVIWVNTLQRNQGCDLYIGKITTWGCVLHTKSLRISQGCDLYIGKITTWGCVLHTKSLRISIHVDNKNNLLTSAQNCGLEYSTVKTG